MTFLDAFVLPPRVIAGQVDVVPMDGRHMLAAFDFRFTWDSWGFLHNAPKMFNLALRHILDSSALWR